MATKQIPLSIVIPTLNEEKYIQNILTDIATSSLTHDEYEIIVADSGSSDQTQEQVEKFGNAHPDIRITFSTAPQKGVSIARNHGATRAKGHEIVFLDADTRIESDFLAKNWAEMKTRKLDVGACYTIPDSNKWMDKLLLNIVNNVGMKIFQYTSKPLALGAAIWSTAEMFHRLGGFDTNIRFGEDIEYVTLARKQGHFAMLNSVPVIFSMRRGEKEGRLKLAGKTLHCFTYHMLHKSMKGIGVTYEFGKYQ